MQRLRNICLAFGAALMLTTHSALAQTDDITPQEKITVHDDRSGKNRTIDLPEGMTLPFDTLINKWMAKKYLYPDTTCVDPDVNPTYTPEEYTARLRQLPVVMDMPYNSIVQEFIDQYTGRLRRSVSYMLGAGNFYIPLFEEALDAYGLPLELKYLPVIESALDPKARSHAGAVGLWQMMLATGKRYDLTVNSLIDERQDPRKSTWAAARYLRDLYKIFGDWNLVIAAYNCGPSTVNKAIHRARGARDYWTIYPYLPKETQGYVPAFIAANYVMNYYCEHNICPLKTKYPITTDTVTVNRDLHFQQIADLCHIDLDAIRALNPQYRTDLVPGSTGPMVVCLPTDHLNALIDLGDSIYNYRADELLTRRATATVNTSRSTARNRQSTTNRDQTAEDADATKAKSNKSTASSRKTKTKASKKTTKKSKKKERTKTATVRQGDTLSEIAARHGTTVKKLRQLNKIKGNLINTGKKIRVK